MRGTSASFFLTPGERPRRAPEVAVTNHQDVLAWTHFASEFCHISEGDARVGRPEALGLPPEMPEAKAAEKSPADSKKK